MSESISAAELQQLIYNERMSTQEALALCDALPSVDLDMMIGRWRGSEIFTRHPMNGLLEILGWYGKEFIDRDHAHPLLFSDQHGHRFALDPKRLPVKLALALPIPRIKLTRQALLAARLILQTSHTRARLRMVEYRGKLSATMIYDNLPICDTFRQLDSNTVLGIMDLKDMPQPFFFKLKRELS